LVAPEGRSQTLTEVRVVLQRGDTRLIHGAFRVAGVMMPRAAEIRVEQVRYDDEPATNLSWQTGGAALPVAAWAGRFPALAQLGPRAEFRGEAAIELKADAWSATLSGELLHVDLDRLVSDQFPHKLSGEANFVLDRVQIRDGQLVSMAGRMDAGPGVIGASLIDAASKHWQWSKHAGAHHGEDDSGARGGYQRISAQFEISSHTLRLAGTCQGPLSETILISQDNASWQTPGESAYPSISLIRVLAGSGELDVPATAAARQLIGVLPLPDPVEKEEPTEPPRGHLHP
jgi:hypothetical protein